MGSKWKRIAMASVVSASGCAITFFWHLKNEPKSNLTSEAEIVAYLAKTNNEIHVKSSDSALWEPAEKLDRLRVGDAIRTSANSEARIQFYKSSRYVDLEADSMIVIQQSESNLNLDLLEGTLFVNGIDRNNKTNLTLSSQGGKFDLSKSIAQLSGSSSSKIDLKILKGSGVFLKGGAKGENIQEGFEGNLGSTGLRSSVEKIRILSPDLTKPVFVNAVNTEPTLIQWNGLPPDAQVLLVSGNNRKSLTPTVAEKLSKNQLQVNWKPGVYFWKLRAIDPDTQKPMGESPVYKTEILGRYPPSPVTPEPNFTLQTRRPTENVTLRWNVSQEFSEVQVDLRNDTTKQNIFSIKLPSSQDFQEAPNLPLGNYSWRLSGFPADGGKPLTGPFHQFFITQKKLIKIPIIWNAKLDATQYFVDTFPKLTLMWEPDTTERVKKWKVHLAPEGTDISKGEAADTRQIKFSKTMPKTGRYLAFVEAFDDENESIGTSETRTFTVTPLPLLPAPKVFPNDESEFLARPDGSLTLSWERLVGTKDYQILVRDNEGKIISELSTETSNYKLTNLMPGTYSLQVGATDNYGRRGDLSGKRILIVPDKSEVKAPKLRKIKVN